MPKANEAINTLETAIFSADTAIDTIKTTGDAIDVNSLDEEQRKKLNEVASFINDEWYQKVLSLRKVLEPLESY